LCSGGIWINPGDMISWLNMAAALS